MNQALNAPICYIVWLCDKHHINIVLLMTCSVQSVCSVCCLILTAHFIGNLIIALICETYFHISASRALSLFS